MTMVNVTAWICGDPAARWTRQPTPAERERGARPEGNRPARQVKVGELGLRVRAMKPGDTIVMPNYSIGNGHRSYMVREFGWTMRLRSRRAGDVRQVELTRVT